jgi:O-methyltransferase
MVDVASTQCAIGDRYLDLLKKTLTRYLTIDEEATEVAFPSALGPAWLGRRLWRPVRHQLNRRGVRLVHTGGDREARAQGRDWPPHAETMVGLARLDNVQQCVMTVVADGVPGDLIETGVWRGGTAIFMRAVLEVAGDAERRVWLADSFEGLPAPNVARYPADAALDLSVFEALAVGLDQVQSNFRRFGLLDERVCFLPGWFKDTLPDAPIQRLAVLRLDGDYYESTMDALVPLYPRLSPGGFVIVDDYLKIPACRQAVDEYRSEHGIVDPLLTIDHDAVYWRRSA